MIDSLMEYEDFVESAEIGKKREGIYELVAWFTTTGWSGDAWIGGLVHY